MCWKARGVMVVGAAVLLSGCAGPQTRQELARLQSQFGLLDERVSQLERTGLSGPTASLGSTAGESWTAFGGTAKSKAGSPTISQPAAAATASLKPTTREIQRALKNAGFYQGAVDGKMGPLTREAAKEFQRVNGLTPDGVVGKQTWAKLSAYADLSSSGGELSAAQAVK